MKRFISSLVLATTLSISGFSMAQEARTVSTTPEKTPAVPTLNDGQTAFNQGNFALAFSLWSRLATQGQPDAQVFVGLSYANGWGVDKSPKIASLWYEKAALKENPSAQFLLGLYLISGEDADLATGVMWLRRAAENGDDSAKRFLKKAKARGWFDNVPTRKYKPEARKTEAVALADTLQ